MSASQNAHGMYGDRARYYDLIYHWKQYGDECIRLHEILQASGVDNGARILEAACGTGSHLAHLKHWYEVAGFDISEPMLTLAREKLPGASIFAADMTDFAVDPPFDALLCLFSSIGYIFPEDRLLSAARCFARAVRPGGALIVEPWLAPESFHEGTRTMQTFQDETLCLCRMSVGRRAGNLSILDFHWLAAERGKPAVDSFIDRHELYLYSTDTLLRIFGDAGFECRFEQNGLMKDRGLLIGRRI